MFLIFPNQLFENIDIIKKDPSPDVYIIEEPLFFHDPIIRSVKTNKIKLAYMVASMRYYFRYLSSHLKKKVHYITYLEAKNFVERLHNVSHIAFYDPLDMDILKRYTSSSKQTQTIYESPNFIMNKHQLDLYFSKHPIHSRHTTFYQYVKDQLNVLTSTSSQDKDNRKPLPRDFHPSNKRHRYDVHLSNTYTFAKTYIDTHPVFSNFPGSTNELSIYPISHVDSKKAVQVFIRNHFKNYGPFQDAIHPTDAFLYHSVLSPMLNNGLLTPIYVVSLALKAKNVPINSVEGFIRQIIGWREYMRYLYVYHYNDLLSSNSLRHNNTMRDWDQWYQGSTGIEPLDNEIKKASIYGYAHHIVRLMIFMNMFILLEIHPEDIYRWFMEVVSIDAYDWVMKSNIYAMGWFYPRAMTKPYISTSNYILKMSKYKRGEWCNIWDALFYRYLIEHKDHLKGSAQIYRHNLRTFYKKPKDKQTELLSVASNFIKEKTVKRRS